MWSAIGHRVIDMGYKMDKDLEIYLKDINRTPLLTKEQEIRIAKRPVKARGPLTEANLRLVVSIAKHYMNKGLDFFDIISEGNIGLMKAVEKYDHTRGFKFSTHATWWIKQAIKRALVEKVRIVRLPANKAEDIIKLKSHGKLGLEESAKKLGPYKRNLVALGRALEAANDVYSIHRNDEEGGDIDLADPKSNIQRHTVDCLSDVERLNEALGKLESQNKRDYNILRMRYGLNDGDPMTLKRVSEKVHLSRERVRQIADAGLKNLRLCLEKREPVENARVYKNPGNIFWGRYSEVGTGINNNGHMSAKPVKDESNGHKTDTAQTEDKYLSFGMLVRERLKQKGLKRYEAAKDVGVSGSTVYSHLSGKITNKDVARGLGRLAGLTEKEIRGFLD